MAPSDDLRDAPDPDNQPLGDDALAALDRGLADLAQSRTKDLDQYQRERGL
ncbi:MAG: hypothetical protein J0L64_28050 [Acidobacteria bacterium]|nr:hypothetical protein [Acidobacteriota bacterium]